MTTTNAALQVSLELDCQSPVCRAFAAPLHEHLRTGYEVCAVQEIPSDLDDWRHEHPTARKRADRAEARGYVAMAFAREGHEKEIHQINMSSAVRQGRPMSSGYRKRPVFSPLPQYPCGRHAIRVTGVFSNDHTLVAYLVMYRAGEVALVSQILGHADHLRNEIMFLLFRQALRREILRGPGVVIYNRWDSGTDGLRTHKTMLGFAEAAVEWLP